MKWFWQRDPRVTMALVMTDGRPSFRWIDDHGTDRSSDAQEVTFKLDRGFIVDMTLTAKLDDEHVEVWRFPKRAAA